MLHHLINRCTKHPVATTMIMVVSTTILGLLAILPSVAPEAFPCLHGVQIDTDPENMLSADEPVRKFNSRMKAELAIHDMLVIGIVNDKAPHYVFNPQTLRDIADLTDYALTLKGEAIGKPEDPHAGIIGIDIIAPSTVDNVEQGGLGTVSFEWLMDEPPETQEEALAVRDKAMNLPFMKGTLVSEDGQAIALYLPLTDKHLSYTVAQKLREKIATFTTGDEYHITGLPIAEDTFGVEMFTQMAISAPLAMLIIILLMLLFFRKLVLIIAPMIVAVVSCIVTMALLIATGNTVHIMSSMIPIFIMPIAVLDTVHVLSAFFDRYQQTKDRGAAIRHVMQTLTTPMLYTSLTTAVAFLSLALTPIPPVQAFGIFVAIGVMAAWVWTMTFVPASIMFINPKTLENFGVPKGTDATELNTPMSRMLRALGKTTYTRAKFIISGAVVLSAIAAWGISKIVINDNPVKWFEPKHEIRIADDVLNAHFGGTYMGYLAFSPSEEQAAPPHLSAPLAKAAQARAETLMADEMPAARAVFNALIKQAKELDTTTQTRAEFYDALQAYANEKTDQSPDEMFDAWDAAAIFTSEQTQSGEVFKDPAVLRWITALQDHLLTIESPDGRPLIGKSNSLADLVRTVYRELMEGKPEFYTIPDTREAVAQTIMQYESSHRPHDLAHFVRTDNWRLSSMWIQQKSGDNRDMSTIVKSVDTYIADNPPPMGIQAEWFGLTYINVIWQEKMVSGMMLAFLGSFTAVWFMMIILYRSALWGFLAMIPLTITIGFIYGVIGFIGKDYDMPVAVLSALSLGMAVDYAIHFISRSREMYTEHGSWEAASRLMFGEPARAITRNVIVIGVGFLPLLAAPLVPYQTVGIFIAAILLTAGIATLFLLPAMITVLSRWLFRDKKYPVLCACGTTFFAGVAAILTIALNIQSLTDTSWSTISYGSLIAIAGVALFCFINNRSKDCFKRSRQETRQETE